MPFRQTLLITLAALVLGAFLSWDVISSVLRGGDSGGTSVADTVTARAAHDARADPEPVVQAGSRVFEAQCSPCHGPRADWPIAARLKGRGRDELYALLDHLPLVNPAMPGFKGTDEERRALAAYLASLRDPRGQAP